MKKLKVLIVEDEFYTARVLREDLIELDCEPLEPVAKGESAIEIALTKNPDLILMDIRLAGVMDGIEAAREIQKKQNIPIIFMSGFATEYFLKKAADIQYMAFIDKPVTLEQLKSIITQLKV
jgi:CheY-like chemotaxis protein